jgi:hypothetical protein
MSSIVQNGKIMRAFHNVGPLPEIRQRLPQMGRAPEGNAAPNHMNERHRACCSAEFVYGHSSCGNWNESCLHLDRTQDFCVFLDSAERPVPEAPHESQAG